MHTNTKNKCIVIKNSIILFFFFVIQNINSVLGIDIHSGVIIKIQKVFVEQEQMKIEFNLVDALEEKHEIKSLYLLNNHRDMAQSLLPYNYPIIIFLEEANPTIEGSYQFGNEEWFPIEKDSKFNLNSVSSFQKSIDKSILNFINDSLMNQESINLLTAFPQNQTIFAEGNITLLRQASRWFLLRNNTQPIDCPSSILEKIVDSLDNGSHLELLPVIFNIDSNKCMNSVVKLDANSNNDPNFKLNLAYEVSRLITASTLPMIHDQILKLLNGSDPHMRKSIARSLVEIHTVDSVTLLIPLLNSGNPDLEYEAIRGIKKYSESKDLDIDQPSIFKFNKDAANYVALYNNFIKIHAKDLGLEK